MKHPYLMAALAAAALAACGGGSDPQPPPVVVTPSITFSGTAATGAAIVGGQVDIKCASGTVGNTGTTTLADGSYTVTIAGAALPCVMRVTTGSAELYSLAEAGNGTAVRANITPFSHMVAAKTVGGDLATFYQSFSVSDQAKLDSTSVAAAITAVTAALSGTASFAGMNPITGSFVIGDAFDQQLDAFKAALDLAQITLADVTTGIVTGGTGPVKTLLQPVSSSCAGLRSGKYRVINPHEFGSDADYVAHLITVDASTLTVTDDLDTSHTPIAITPDATSACKFTLPGDFGTATLLVAPSGVAVLRAPSSTGQTVASVVLPEQAIPVSELAGTWNYLGYVHDSGALPLTPVSGTTTIDASGAFTAGTECIGLDTCTDDTAPFGSLVANPAGGFDEGSTARAFVFKTASGAMSLFLIDTSDGSIVVGTKQAALRLPVVGAQTSFWDFSINSTGLASALSDAVVTVTTVDAAAQSFTRTRSADGRVDGFTINQPRNGLRHRAAGSSPTNGGGTVNYSAINVLPLPGTGVSVNVSTAANQNFFGISVNKP